MVSAIQNSVNATFTYDADGIRTSRTVNSVTTNFVTDKNRDYAQVVAEVENNQTKATYTYGSDLISQNRSGTSSYYLYDALGSVKALSDSTGAVTDTYNYTAFGKDLNHVGTTTNAYKYAGEQYDAELDNYYLRARYYNQNVGRFTQMDTWNGNSQDPVTLHKYLYANVNPVSYTDPSGRFGLAEASVTMEIVSLLTQMQVDNGLNVLGSQGADVESAQFANKMLGLAALGSGGIKLLKFGYKKFLKAKDVTFSPIKPGPLSPKVTSTFRSGTYTQIIVKEPTVLYRVYGGRAGQFRSYWTKVKPTGPIQSKIDSAILDEWENAQTGLSTIRVPEGTIIYEGAAAPQLTEVQELLGGGNQVYIEYVDPSWVIK
jgi:RHS repeat-associated protein